MNGRSGSIRSQSWNEIHRATSTAYRMKVPNRIMPGAFIRYAVHSRRISLSTPRTPRRGLGRGRGRALVPGTATWATGPPRSLAEQLLALGGRLVQRLGGGLVAVDGLAELGVEGIGDLAPLGVGGGLVDRALRLVGEALEPGVVPAQLGVGEQRLAGRQQGGRRGAEGPQLHVLRAGQVLDPQPGRVLVLALAAHDQAVAGDGGGAAGRSGRQRGH